MKDANVKIGMKVVPHRKTAWGGLETSIAWRNATELHQPFLYVTAWDYEVNVWVLDEYDVVGGDFFNASDFEMYLEGTTQREEEVIPAMSTELKERCEESMLSLADYANKLYGSKDDIVQYNRIVGKIEGIRLVLSYAEEYERNL